MDWLRQNGYLTSANSKFIRLPVLQLPGDVPHIAGKMVWMKLDLAGTYAWECALILLFIKKWRRLRNNRFSPFALSPKDLIITGLHGEKEILKMHGQCDYMLMIK